MGREKIRHAGIRKKGGKRSIIRERREKEGPTMKANEETTSQGPMRRSRELQPGKTVAPVICIGCLVFPPPTSKSERAARTPEPRTIAARHASARRQEPSDDFGTPEECGRVRPLSVSSERCSAGPPRLSPTRR